MSDALATTLDDVPHDLSFLVGIRKRVPLEGNGPRAIVVADNTAYVAEYFSDTIGAIDLSQDRPVRAEQLRSLRVLTVYFLHPPIEFFRR